MSYVKTTWVTGDIVTAPKLNNLESGVEANDLNKLNKPSGNGTAGQLLISNGDGSTSWTDTDTTLEESGKAADAKATGDAIGEINEALETKAEIDGYYEEMTVGDAEQLVSTVYVEESTPYLYRTTGGSADVGNREYLDKLVGVSVPWNQLFRELGTTYWTSTDATFSNGVATWNPTAQYSQITQASGYGSQFINGHKYLVVAQINSAASNPLNIYSQSGVYFFGGTVSTNGYQTISGIATYNKTSATSKVIIQANGASGWGTIYVKGIMLIDLTSAFGTTIADYVYSLEQATAGSGIAWLKQYIDLDAYHAYSAPTLKHVEDLQSHDTVGFNQWDEEWEIGDIDGVTGAKKTGNYLITKNYIPVLPNTTYYFNIPSTVFYYLYDENKNAIQTNGYAYRQKATSGTVTTTENTHFIMFRNNISSASQTYHNDICINLSWSGYRNGEYEPYEKHSYALDSSVALRGVPTLVDGQMVYDGDEYLYDGTINRRYGIVDLGTLTWSYNVYDLGSFTSNGIASVVASRNIICTKYPTLDASSSTAINNNDKFITVNKGNNTTGGLGSGVLIIKDTAYTDVATFTATLSGVYLVYELATPTTETADPYTQVQICDDFGTEQFVTTSIISVGTATRYPANLRDKLQHLPSLAENDGTYLIQQTDKEMSLIPFSGYVTEESLTETLEDYAKTDGYYEGMTVGNAEELVTGLTEEENVPYIFRTSGGSLEIGARENMTVVGGSLAWNQLIQKNTPNVYVQNNVTTTYDSTKDAIVVTSNKDASDVKRARFISHVLPANTVYFLSAEITNHCSVESTTLPGVGIFRNSEAIRKLITATESGQTNKGAFVIKTGDGHDSSNTDFIGIRIPNDAPSGDYVEVKNFNFINLTQMFGTTIADYINSLETATAGAGVAWFKKLFPKDYYPYQVADLVHVNASEFKTVGFNQLPTTPVYLPSNTPTLDKTKAVRVIAGQTYRYEFSGITGATSWRTAFRYWDLDGNLLNTSPKPFTANPDGISWNINNNTWVDGANGVIKARTFTFNKDGYVMLFFAAGDTSSSNVMNDACMFIHWDDTRNGEYEPYTEHSYPLDSSLVLRGIPKIDADGNLYYDGDTYEADGTVTRRYGVITFDGDETENWKQGTNNSNLFYITLNLSAFPYAWKSTVSAQTNLYVYAGAFYNQYGSHLDPGEFLLYWTATDPNVREICVREQSIDTLSAFKTKLSTTPLVVVYELATPTTETADLYQTPQIVDNWGTEEFVVTAQNGVEVPVGHSTIYPISLRDKLEAAPDLPADDGDYILRMSGNEASYARLASEFPTPPTTDGSYLLKATVTNGTATLTWEAQS